MSIPGAAIASSIDRIGADELLVRARSRDEEALVGEGGDARGLVATGGRERMVIRGT